MFERELLTKLRTWRDKSLRKPLVLRGARQVGKTTLVDEFAKEFDAYINVPFYYIGQLLTILKSEISSIE